MCVCVFFPSILDIKFVGRTSRGHTGGRSHRIFNPPSFCGACLDFCREKDSCKLKKTKVLHGIERVPQCGCIILITVYLHQNNSDQVLYGVEKKIIYI